MNLLYVSQDFFFFLKSNLIHLVGGVSVPSVPTLWGSSFVYMFSLPYISAVAPHCSSFYGNTAINCSKVYTSFTKLLERSHIVSATVHVINLLQAPNKVPTRLDGCRSFRFTTVVTFGCIWF